MTIGLEPPDLSTHMSQGTNKGEDTDSCISEFV